MRCNLKKEPNISTFAENQLAELSYIKLDNLQDLMQNNSRNSDSNESSEIYLNSGDVLAH